MAFRFGSVLDSPARVHGRGGGAMRTVADYLRHAQRHGADGELASSVSMEEAHLDIQRGPGADVLEGHEQDPAARKHRPCWSRIVSPYLRHRRVVDDRDASAAERPESSKSAPPPAGSQSWSDANTTPSPTGTTAAGRPASTPPRRSRRSGVRGRRSRILTATTPIRSAIERTYSA